MLKFEPELNTLEAHHRLAPSEGQKENQNRKGGDRVNKEQEVWFLDDYFGWLERLLLKAWRYLKGWKAMSIITATALSVTIWALFILWIVAASGQ